MGNRITTELNLTGDTWVHVYGAREEHPDLIRDMLLSRYSKVTNLELTRRTQKIDSVYKYLSTFKFVP